MTESRDSQRRDGRAVRSAALLAVFMISLDASIVNIAVPTLARGLRASLPDLQWILDGYIAAFASLLLVTAKLSRRVGAINAMRIGLTGFTAASLGCALAPSAGALVAARIAQGFAASLILPSGLTLVTRLAGGNRQGRAFGIFSAVVGAATALGPSAGALILGDFSWRGIFLVNVPIGVIVLRILGGQGQIAARAATRTRWADGGVSAVGMFALCYGLIRVGRDGWGSTLALALIAAGLGALAMFGVLQARRPAGAVLDATLLRRRSILGANVATLLTFTAMMGVTFLAPLVLIELYGYSLGQTAAVLSLTSLVILVVAPVSGRMIEAGPLGAVAVLGCVAEGAAIWGFSFLGPDPAFGSVAVAAAALGLAFGLLLPPLTAWAMSVPVDQVEDCSALFSTARQIGLALGVALFGSLASIEIGHELAHVAEISHAHAIAKLSLAQLAASGPRSVPAPPVADAIWRGLATTFRLGSGLSLIAAVTIAGFGRRFVYATAEQRPAAGWE